MSMELHTLRAVKITQNIFELNRVNRELVVVRKIVEDLEQRKKFEDLFGSYAFGIIPKILSKIQKVIYNLLN